MRLFLYEVCIFPKVVQNLISNEQKSKAIQCNVSVEKVEIHLLIFKTLYFSVHLYSFQNNNNACTALLNGNKLRPYSS